MFSSQEEWVRVNLFTNVTYIETVTRVNLRPNNKIDQC